MLHKEEILWVSDNTNLEWLKIFHIYKLKKNSCRGIGNYVYASVKSNMNIAQNLKNSKINLKKNRSLAIRLRNKVLYLDGSTFYSFDNSAAILLNTTKFLSGTLTGYTYRFIGILKLIVYFKQVL